MKEGKDMITKITGAALIMDEIVRDSALYLKDDKILAVTREELPYDQLLDAQGCYLSPGFIDIHTHGGGGHDFMDGGVEPILEGCRMHLRHGTTSILPTTLASAIPALKRSILDIGEAMKIKGDYPHIIGAHLEGPYFSQNQSGAQDPRYIKAPQPKEYEEILEMGEGIIKRWSFAPELDGADAFCEALVRRNVIPSIAHSDAVYADVKAAYDKGCRLVTHLYSGMSTVTRKGGFRSLGVVESAFLLDNIIVETIADGMHLPPELLLMIYKIKGPDRICLVTDSMRGAGMPDGPSILGRKEDGMACIIEGGVAFLPDHSAFAGSVATTDRLVRTFVKAGVGLCDAVKMASTTPAKVLGLKKGRLEPSYDADLVLFDDAINVKGVILDGRCLDLAGTTL